MKNNSENIPVIIESVAYGGKGVARVDGKVFFVDDAVTGDECLVEVYADNGRYADARIVSLSKPSALREPSPCRWSSACGGCQWFEIAYHQQLIWKKQFIATSLRRIGRLPEPTMQRLLDFEVEPSPATQNYRNRIFVRGVIESDGQPTIGYFRKGTRDLVKIERCAIAADQINRVVEQLRLIRLPASAGTKFRMELQEVFEPNQSGVVISVYPPENPTPALDPLIAALGKLPGVVWAGYVMELARAPLVAFGTGEGAKGQITYNTQAGLFQQVNLPMNDKMRAWVRNHVEKLNAKRVLDVFCGSGNLSLQLIDGTRFVEGVEYSKRAIDVAQCNVAANRLTNAVYIAGDAEKHLWKCARNGERFDLIIADPPREGMFGALIPIMKIAPAAIIYISCDPTTLARDLGSLCKSAYEIVEITAFDFFPNTFHIETAVLLKRATNSTVAT